MSVEWRTAEEMNAGKQELVDAMPGWEMPLVHGLGLVRSDGGIEFRTTNYPRAHDLPAIALATVTGHRTGTASYVLDQETFARAIATLSPAEAYTAVEHPNLWAWKQVRADFESGALAADTQVVAVFVGEESDEVTNDAVRQIRHTVGLDA